MCINCTKQYTCIAIITYTVPILWLNCSLLFCESAKMHFAYPKLFKQFLLRSKIKGTCTNVINRALYARHVTYDGTLYEWKLSLSSDSLVNHRGRGQLLRIAIDSLYENKRFVQVMRWGSSANIVHKTFKITNEVIARNIVARIVTAVCEIEKSVQLFKS